MTHHIVLDLSRLLSRAERAVPTGIDRVELAYAEHWLGTAPEDLTFVGMLSWGRFGALSKQRALALVEALGRAWGSDPPDAAAAKRAADAARRLRLERLWRGSLGLGTALRRRPGRPIYVHISHQRLERMALIERLKQRHGALFGCFLYFNNLI